MVGQTSQTVEIERQREAEMFKLFELLQAVQLTKLTPTLTSSVKASKLTSTEEHSNDTSPESTAVS